MKFLIFPAYFFPVYCWSTMFNWQKRGGWHEQHSDRKIEIFRFLRDTFWKIYFFKFFKIWIHELNILPITNHSSLAGEKQFFRPGGSVWPACSTSVGQSRSRLSNTTATSYMITCPSIWIAIVDIKFSITHHTLPLSSFRLRELGLHISQFSVFYLKWQFYSNL